MTANDILRRLPKVDFLMERLGASADLQATRAVLERLRRDIISGELSEVPDECQILAMIADTAHAKAVRGLRKVINATGIVLHTNLGRAPMSSAVAEHVKQVALGYSTLEYNLETGQRGSRTATVETQLVELCGAEAAVCVNNNAAAVLAVLSALCGGRKVVVSRGELVEIGGSFRVPEIIAQGGARLMEVGTTNKTRLADYQSAISDDTAAILKMHTSNYRIVGYTEDTMLSDLANLATERSIPLIYDLGGGALVKLSQFEPTVQEVVAQGADIVCFSGDKLFGGPQCGIILGKKIYIDKVRKHPLYRAMRMDKLSLAALEATLKLYESGGEIPVLAMLTANKQDLKSKADELLKAIGTSAHFDVEVVETMSQAGGGSLPAEDFPSFALAVMPKSLSLQEMEQRFRCWDTPIIARIHKDRLLLDVRTVAREDFPIVAAALEQIGG